MKHVVSKSDVAHLWANQSQDNARNAGGNFYFDGRTIYSYGRHFSIATISEKDSNTVYFTTRTYSNTTAKHIGVTRYACSHKTRIYCFDPESAGRGIHSENLESFEKSAKNIAANLPTSRKPEKYLSSILSVFADFQAYCNHFGITFTADKYIHGQYVCLIHPMPVPPKMILNAKLKTLYQQIKY